jgi:hypothetical protein
VFGSLIVQADHFLFGVRAALVISTLLLVAAAIAIGWQHGARSRIEPEIVEIRQDFDA